ncbi:MAG: TrkH family potassium uptake protein [Rikenellaceae bacterium]|nr:TrkH family potassium uptake protein [Rikenellaceae bacterium]
MRYSVVIRYIGMVLLVLAAFMLASAGISYMSGVDSAYTPLVMSSLLTLLMGCFPLIFVPRTDRISQKEAYCIVVGAWVVASIVGMFPYLMWGGEFTPINAWFESVSGFTTTGASILNDIEALPRGLLFWRMSTSWIGGIGVVMFALVILPSIGKSKMMLSHFELSSLAKDNFNLYRTPTVVRIILSVYIGLTIASTLILKLCGMNWFDALCHAMSACGTCGFSTKNLSIGWFNSPLIEMVLVVIMAVAGIHFGLIFATLTRKKNNIFRSEITRAYFSVIAVSALLIGISIWAADVYPSLWTSLRSALFHTVSLITTTGFATADCNTWTSFAMLILIFCSIVCACAGSTSGGLKMDRLWLAIKMLRNRLRSQQHPNAIIRTKVDGIPQDKEMLNGVMVYIVAYMLLILAGAFINTMLGADIITGFSSSIACVSNVGPGFGEVGTMDNYSFMPAVMKFNLTALMLFGRLEIFGLIQLFFIRWWR